MSKRFAQVVLVLLGLNFLLVGVTGLTDPHKLMEPVQLEIAGANGLSEVRAGYGGTHLALGLLFLVAAVRASWRRVGLIVAAVFTCGLAGGRVVSLLLDGPPGGFIWLLFIAESIGAATTLFALRLTRAPTEA